VPLRKGADLAVFLGSSSSDGITGKLISAVWDPWKTLPNHLDDLNGTDIYTLRRIVPKDRGITLGGPAIEHRNYRVRRSRPKAGSAFGGWSPDSLRRYGFWRAASQMASFSQGLHRRH